MRRIVDTKEGKMVVFDTDQFLGRSLIEYGEFSYGETHLFEFAVGPDDVVADIGANFGAHTLVFARRAKKVYAVEPQKTVFDALSATVSLNNLKNVVLINGAVGEEEGEIGVAQIDFSKENNFGGLGLLEIPQEYLSYKVPMFKFTTPVSFMKIDVEGMEAHVLRGSADMIREYRPVIYIENDRKSNSEELITLLRELGYFLKWHMVPLFNPNNYFKNPVDVFGDVCSLNMLCLPEDMDIPGMEPVTDFFYPMYAYTQ